MKIKLILSLALTLSLLVMGCEEAEAKPKPKTRGTVTFIFDDGNRSILTNAVPIFRKHHVTGSLAINTNSISKKGMLSATELKTLNKQGWEILSHTVNHKNLKNASANTIKYELRESKAKFKRMGITVRGFVAPYSVYPDREMKTLKDNYNYAFTKYVDSRTAPINKVMANSRNTHTNIRANMEGKTLDQLKQYVDYAHKNGVWLVLYEHNIVTKNSGSRKSTTTKDLDELIKYAKNTGVSIRTSSQVYKLK